MTESKYPISSILTNIFAGAGMGLLVGLIVGLSVSPVVSVILGALASLLAAFLGLQPGSDETPADGNVGGMLSRLQQNSLKAGSFGFACVAAIFLGLFIRNHDIFDRPPIAQLQEWKKAGFDEDYARQLIVLQKFGIDPATKTVNYGETQKAHSGALFSGKSESDICSALDPERYDNNVAQVLKAYRRLGLPKLTHLADVIEQMSIPESDKQSLLIAISEAVCEQQ